MFDFHGKCQMSLMSLKQKKLAVPWKIDPLLCFHLSLFWYSNTLVFFYDVFAFRGKCSLCHSGLKYTHTNVKAKYFSGAMLIYTSWSSGKFLKALL